MSATQRLIGKGKLVCFGVGGQVRVKDKKLSQIMVGISIITNKVGDDQQSTSPKLAKTYLNHNYSICYVKSSWYGNSLKRSVFAWILSSK